jgi:hypothetical protein
MYNWKKIKVNISNKIGKAKKNIKAPKITNKVIGRLISLVLVLIRTTKA